MEIAALLAQLDAEGGLLPLAAEHAGWDAPVPACADWTVRDVVVHTGGVHRWAADIVRTRGRSFDTAASDAVGSGPTDGELLDWFRTGHAELVETLRSAPDDLDCATFLPADSPRHFWARRQAHETAIHRADVMAAVNEPVEFPADFAQDGIAEMLLGFARRRREPAAREVTLALAASDGPSWLVRAGGERVAAEQGTDGEADARIAGSSSGLYLWVWNRPSTAVVTGDPSAAELWASTVRVRWG